MPCVLAFDIGGTKLACGVVDKDGRVLARTQLPTAGRDAGMLLGQMADLAPRALSAAGLAWRDICAVGIGAPGILNPEATAVLQAANVPALDGLPVVALLGERWPCPVFLENDANAAAVGEWLYGAGQGVRNLIYMTVSTGIGGGFVLDGRVYRGRGGAGEIGHMSVVPGGRRCGCGRRGCVEAYASGTAIARIAAERLETDRASILRLMVRQESSSVTAAMVAQAAAQGDGLARAVWAEAMSHLGHCVGNLINLLHPDRVVIGGGVSATGDQLLTPVRAAVAERVMPELEGQAEVVLSRLGSDSGVVGAAAVAWTGLRSGAV